jgi:hypothetical protein
MFDLFRFGRLPLLAAEGEGGGGEGAGGSEGQGEVGTQGSGTEGASGQGQEKTGNEGGAKAAGESGQDGGKGGSEKKGDGGAKVAEKPEGLPDHLWDAETGQLKTDEVVKELSQGGQKQGESKAPEDPSQYELKVPESVELPEGLEWQFDENQPEVQIGRQMAQQMGLDQKGFEEQLLKPFIEAKVQEHNAETERQAAELQKLGENVTERIDSLSNRIDQSPYSDDEKQALKSIASTAAGVTALEKLMRTGPQAPTRENAEGAAASKLTRNDLERKMASQEYRRGDPAVVKEVQEGFRKLYPGEHRRIG